jgi:beta-carotene 3-hydroxylase
MTEVLIVLVCFLAMEPVAAAAHRLVMHGWGWAWHRSHHRGRHDRWERNDRFPAVFACFTVAVMAWGAYSGRPGLVAAGAGVSAYGLAYLVVHDICVHGRLTGGRPLLPGRWLRWVASCHATHHRTGAAPYGFLLPLRPHAGGAGTRAVRPLRRPELGPVTTATDRYDSAPSRLH